IGFGSAPPGDMDPQQDRRHQVSTSGIRGAARSERPDSAIYRARSQIATSALGKAPRNARRGSGVSQVRKTNRAASAAVPGRRTGDATKRGENYKARLIRKP